MDKDNIKIESWLPIFPGFYGSIWEFNIDDDLQALDDINERRQELNLDKIDKSSFMENYPEFEIDMDEVKEHVGYNYCEKIQEILKDFCEKIEFTEIWSPKFYNYSNDTIHCTYIISKDNISKIIDYIKSNKDEFSEHLKDRFTSRDGFISNYSNQYDDWIKKIETKSWENFQHEFGSIVEFMVMGLKNSNATDIDLEIRGGINDFYYTNFIENFEEFLK